MVLRFLSVASGVGLFGLSLLAPSLAHAAAIGVCDNTTAPSGPDTAAGSNGTCGKTITLSGNTLTIVLSNTTDPAFGGFLTADAFNLPGVTASLASTTNANFTLSTNPTVSPFDNMGLTFNYLLSATNNDWEGGGNPSAGIPAGGTATFILNLSTTAGLTEAGVLASEAIRFRGFLNGGSDKDLAVVGTGTPVVPPPPPPVPVPEPASMLLLGTGLATGAMLRRRGRRPSSSQTR